jgi:NTP pyrophosphatase (non-canonical NTP hydrolase)
MFKAFEKSLNAFVKDRNWDRYHHIRNTAMAFSCEVAELVELFTLYDYKEQLEEVAKEIGDCLISLFSIYRVLKFDIHMHLQKGLDCEKATYQFLLSSNKSASCLEFLIKYLSVRAGFLQEPFLWMNDEESKNYHKTLPIKTLVEPFNILLSICYLLNFKAIDLMDKKLLLTQKKYSVENCKDPDYFNKIKEIKSEKRGE